MAVDGDTDEHLIEFTDLTDFSKYTIHPTSSLPGTTIHTLRYISDVQKLAITFSTNNVGDASQAVALSSNGSGWIYVDHGALPTTGTALFARTFDVGGGDVRTRVYLGARADVGAGGNVAAYINITDYNPSTQFRVPFISSGESISYVRYN